jgi:hypothetical protein
MLGADRRFADAVQVSAASGQSDADSEPLEERELMALGEVMDHSDGHVRAIHPG